MTLELRDETGAELDRLRQAGNFASVDDVVTTALELLDAYQAKAEVRAKIAAGFAQVDRGELLDGHEVFRELLASLGGSASPDGERS